ncbi:MAG: hypothetical protein RLZZ555_2163 [Pseudomonadota bacterium]|jgi:hypothetical protein
MSMLHQFYLLEKFGPRLRVEQLADALGLTTAAINRRISDGTLGIPTYIDSGKRWADARDVAEYFDAMRAEARQHVARGAGLPA